MVLRLLLQRVDAADLTLASVWVGGGGDRKLAREQRQIVLPGDGEANAEVLASGLVERIALEGGGSNGSDGWGGAESALCFVFAGNTSDERIARVVGWGRTGTTKYHDRELPSAAFDPVGEDHIWRAVQELITQGAEHSFGESSDYDVVLDGGARLPPKAVFGVAAAKALGFEVQPWHFQGGLGTRCFSAIRSAGYRILRKGDAPPSDDVPGDPEVRVWIEGDRRLVTHLRLERASGLGPAKRREMKRRWGYLFCEKCELDPRAAYGPEVGDACIEVHHTRPLSSVSGRRETKLEDVICVCANCHRVIHYELERTT